MKKLALFFMYVTGLCISSFSATYTMSSHTFNGTTLKLTFSLKDFSPEQLKGNRIQLEGSHEDSSFVPLVHTKIMTAMGSSLKITRSESVSDTFTNVCIKNNKDVLEKAVEQPFLDSGFIFRDIKGYELTISPFQYEQQSNSLIVHKEIRMTISGEFASLPKTMSKTPPSFRTIYKEQFCNFPEAHLLRNDHYLSDGDKMVIISHQDYIAEMEPLKSWKELKGIRTTIVSYPSKTGEGIEKLQAYIRELYQEKKPTYLILVGDANDIPPQISFSYDSAASDPTYVMLEGGEYDWYPEMLLGRLSVSTPNEAALVVRKIINYEKHPSSSDNWNSKALIISDDDYYEAGDTMTTIDKISDTCTTKLEASGYTTTKLYDPGATQDELISHINNGMGLIYYMGHGDRALWSTTAFDYEDFPLLNNGWKTPIVLSHGCNNGEFDTTTAHQPICLAESFIRTGSIEDGGGAVAFLGGTDKVLQDYQIAFYEMARLLGTDEQFSLGTVICNGKIKALSEGGGGPKNMKRLTLFGDPSLQVFTDIALPFNVTLPDTIADGDESIPITAPLGSIITLQSASQKFYISHRVTNENTQLSINDAKSEDIYVTITGKNRVPYLDTIINTKSVNTIFALSTTQRQHFFATVQNNRLRLTLPPIEASLYYEIALIDLQGRVLLTQQINNQGKVQLSEPLHNRGTRCAILRLKDNNGNELHRQKLLIH